MPRLAREVLHGSLADGMNAAVECCDRWVGEGRVALNWIGKNFAVETLTFEALRDQSARDRAHPDFIAAIPNRDRLPGPGGEELIKRHRI